jgi:hypothetical protein
MAYSLAKRRVRLWFDVAKIAGIVALMIAVLVGAGTGFIAVFKK